MNRLLLLLFLLCGLASAAGAQASLVINEAIYDNPGSDVDCWLELKGDPGMSLNGYRVVGINGANNSIYATIALDGYAVPASGYFLIVQNSANHPNYNMISAAVNFQNGPDNIQVQQNVVGGWVVVDAVGYGTFGGSDPYFAGEGNPCQGQGSTLTNSMARCPDGHDTNNNAADFISDPNPTPGAMNMGNCSVPTGACCFADGTCQVQTQAACGTAGGTYRGDGTACSPNPCPQPPAACCFTDGTCQMLSQADCATVGGNYQGNGTSCTPSPCPQPPTDYTLCQIQQLDANAAPVHLNEYVRVHGTAIVASNLWQGTGNNVEFQITDGQCCIDVFKAGTTTPFVNPGDYVEVVGTVGNYNGLIQIQNPNCTITIQGSGYPIPEPGVVTTNELAVNGNNYESCLVKIRCGSITSGAWPANGQNVNLTFDDGTGPVILRIDKDTDIDGSPAPTGPFTVVGVVYQFDSTSPYTEGFEILPRSLNDLYLNDCAPPTGACCFPNGNCSVLTANDCAAQGGTYRGDNTTCDPNPCTQPTGACCFANGNCTVVTAATCASQGGTWQGANVPCTPLPCQAPEMSLCEVTRVDANGAPIHNNAWVKLHGTAIVASNLWQGTGNNVEFQITDGNCCVDIFKSGTTTPFVNPGDYVEVVGTVVNYNGLIQVGNPNCTITIQGSGYPIPQPGVITTHELAVNGQNYESCLIKIRCVNIVSGTWPAAGQNSNLMIDDGTGQVILRIDKDTNIDGSPAPTGPFTVIGVVAQFDSSSPYTDGYEILPRSLDDLLLNDCLPAAGACCFPDGHCNVMLATDCAAQGGRYQGDGSLCDPNPCTQPTGACCFVDGHCTVLTALDCQNQDGTWQGMDTVCEPNNCPQPPMACCFPDGHCEFVTAQVCATLGGTPQGYGTVCEPNPCPQPLGACCFQNGDCVMLNQADCTAQGGTWQGMSVACAPENPCPQPPPTGACCLDDQGHCEVLTQQQCNDAHGSYQGDNTTCEPQNPCPIVPTQKTTWGQIKGKYR